MGQARPVVSRVSYDFIGSAEALERRRLFSTLGHSLPDNTPRPTLPDTGGPKAALVVPSYESNPAAAVRLELDFDGDSVPTWGSYNPGTVAAFDRDGDATTFDPFELDVIKEVWQRIAEKYSPFNVNVTTNVSGNLGNGQVFKLDIGGSYNDWYGAPAGGVAYVNGFTNSSPNIGFVFANEGVYSPKSIAEAGAHEAGHGFGLEHQSTWENGQKTEEYSSNNGSPDFAPVMGVTYSTDRGLWWHGLNADNAFQNDASVLADVTNGFGYRPDEAGTFNAPQALAFTNSAASKSGVITATPNVANAAGDADFYGFTLTKTSIVALKVSSANIGAMLNSELYLYDSNGVPVGASNANADTLPEWLTFTLAPGTYRARISGVDETARHNGDNVGQYTLQGFQFAPGPYTVVAGSSVTLNASPAANAAANAGYTTEWDLDYDGVTFTTDTFAHNPVFTAPATAGGTTRTVGLRVGDGLGFTAVIPVLVNITNSTATPAKINGTVYNDANGNAVFDTATEKGIGGVTVYVDTDNDGVKEDGDPTTVTDANGFYSFSISAGTHKIRQVLPGGFVQTTPANGFGWQVTVGSGQTIGNRNFGDKPTAPVATGSIAGTVWRDADGDGVKDSGETGLSGVFVYSDANNNGAFDTGEASTTTDSVGAYKFTNLPAATYKIRQIVPSGYSQTIPTKGYGIQVILGNNQTATSKNFGNKPTGTPSTGSISGVAFNDSNADGVYNGIDSLAGGKTIWLDLDDDGIKDSSEPSTVTASNGTFGFTGLAARTYHVRRLFPSGYGESTPSRYITLTAGQSVTGVYIGSKTK